MTDKKSMSRGSIADVVPEGIRQSMQVAVDMCLKAEKASKLCDFDDVVAAERGQIHLRRFLHANPGTSDTARMELQSRRTDAPEVVHGLALSGGGIRSATFSIGVLQAMQRLGKLGRFDYLSTVSGGGFAGGWWSAWLSRRSRENEPRGASLLPPPEGIEPDRAPNYRDGAVEASQSARHGDALHHVRLFANYLTPRKGLLSADTWMAGTVIGRNLLLTWIILVPVMLTAVLIGQLFFAVALGERFYVFDAAQRGSLALEKLQVAAGPLLVLLAWLGTVILLWMLNSVPYWLPALGGIAVVGFMAWFTTHAFDVSAAGGDFWSNRWVSVALAGIVVVTLYFIIPLLREGFTPDPRARDLRRNRLARLQTTVVRTGAIVTVAFLIGGFGNDIAWYLFHWEQGHAIYDYVMKSGGIAAAVIGVVSAVYTAIAASPTGGGDVRDSGRGKVAGLAFVVAPPLMLAVLGVSLAAMTHNLVAATSASTLSQLRTATWLGVLLLLVLAAYETIRDEMELPLWRRWTVVLAPTGVGLAVLWFLPPETPVSRALTIAALAAAFVSIAGRWASIRAFRFMKDRFAPWTVLVAAGVAFGVLAWSLAARYLGGPGADHLTRAVVATLLFCAAFAVAETLWAGDDRKRAASLVAIAFVGLLSIALPGILQAATPTDAVPGLPVAHVNFALMVIALSTVVGFGWLADPNQLSMHTFYRMRLVRAYLGASNEARESQHITESHPHDDMALHQLRNCERGAPYHIINATLNLVGGRDLATAQRYADNFVLSSLYCGSARTGYRATREYMAGSLSLGAAIAVSGAAVSPTMGAKTPSAALATLLTLFNVRLGYWAPTPNAGRYRSRQARLWPFYTLRESLSQTNALSTYCYLTDGGHFDNTGLHALVERGCRVIVVVDCGADPKPAFEDIGTAVRRCRIDFGAQISLTIDPFRPTERLAKAHAVMGEIVYSREHAEKLGWGKGLAEGRRKGVVVWIKPARTGGEALDVAQYGIANDAFPQQATSDQWYDEAQFESYRRLGEESAIAAFEDGAFDKSVQALVP